MRGWREHPRNHALIAKERDWQLSPAYDLTPSPVIARDRRDLAMEIGDQGRFANAKNLLSQSTRFLLEEEEAKKIVSDMTDKVRSTWYDVVRAQGVREKRRGNDQGRLLFTRAFCVNSSRIEERSASC
jgi:serine/threonine-protein kinase HipA